ncbi:MAG: NUMOD4 domain-containing protein [Christensenellales bacterium]
MLEVIVPDEKFDVLDKNGRYLISNYGRCYSIKSNRFIKPNINNKGYARFDIQQYKNNERIFRKQIFAHIAVVEHFGDKFGNTLADVSNYIDKINIDHRNKNRLDNRQQNLQIVSFKCNQQRKYLNEEEIDDINNYINIQDIF